MAGTSSVVVVAVGAATAVVGVVLSLRVPCRLLGEVGPEKAMCEPSRFELPWLVPARLGSVGSAPIARSTWRSEILRCSGDGWSGSARVEKRRYGSCCNACGVCLKKASKGQVGPVAVSSCEFARHRARLVMLPDAVAGDAAGKLVPAHPQLLAERVVEGGGWSGDLAAGVAGGVGGGRGGRGCSR